MKLIAITTDEKQNVHIFNITKKQAKDENNDLIDFLEENWIDTNNANWMTMENLEIVLHWEHNLSLDNMQTFSAKEISTIKVL